MAIIICSVLTERDRLKALDDAIGFKGFKKAEPVPEPVKKEFPLKAMRPGWYPTQ